MRAVVFAYALVMGTMVVLLLTLTGCASIDRYLSDGMRDQQYSQTQTILERGRR